MLLKPIASESGQLLSPEAPGNQMTRLTDILLNSVAGRFVAYLGLALLPYGATTSVVIRGASSFDGQYINLFNEQWLDVVKYQWIIIGLTAVLFFSTGLVFRLEKATMCATTATCVAMLVLTSGSPVGIMELLARGILALIAVLPFVGIALALGALNRIPTSPGQLSTGVPKGVGRAPEDGRVWILAAIGILVASQAAFRVLLRTIANVLITDDVFYSTEEIIRDRAGGILVSLFVVLPLLFRVSTERSFAVVAGGSFALWIVVSNVVPPLIQTLVFSSLTLIVVALAAATLGQASPVMDDQAHRPSLD